jgi:hypothetical protein
MSSVRSPIPQARTSNSRASSIAKLTEPLAHVLNELGSKAALIIHGANGLDELNTTGAIASAISKMALSKPMISIPPISVSRPPPIQDLRGGTPDESAEMMKDDSFQSNSRRAPRRRSAQRRRRPRRRNWRFQVRAWMKPPPRSIAATRSTNSTPLDRIFKKFCAMNILEKIIEHKKIGNCGARRLSLTPRRRAESSASRFSRRIKRRRFSPRPSLIAELKRASPSKGLLAPHLDLFQVADLYTQNGASAISVLTDEKFFMGNLNILRKLGDLRPSTFDLHPAPLLRKDFIHRRIPNLRSPRQRRRRHPPHRRRIDGRMFTSSTCTLAP